MRLEDKFFNSFFYLFLIGITFSIVIVITILFYFSDNFLDERTASEVFHLEDRYAKSKINSMNILLTNLVVKLQVVLQEQVTLYQDIAKTLVNLTNDLNLDDIDVYNVYELKEKINSNDPKFTQRLSYASLWLIDTEIKDVNKLTLEIKKQIYSFSLMTQSLLSVVNSNNDILKSIFLIFLIILLIILLGVLMKKEI